MASGGGHIFFRVALADWDDGLGVGGMICRVVEEKPPIYAFAPSMCDWMRSFRHPTRAIMAKAGWGQDRRDEHEPEHCKKRKCRSSCTFCLRSTPASDPVRQDFFWTPKIRMGTLSCTETK